MKQLTWKKKVERDGQYTSTFWRAKIPKLNWEFTIEEDDKRYAAYVYLGEGEDIILSRSSKTVDSAKTSCVQWIRSMAKTLSDY